MTKPYAKGQILGVISKPLQPYDSGFLRMNVAVQDGKFPQYLPIVWYEGGHALADKYKEGDTVIVNFKVGMYKPKGYQYYMPSLIGVSMQGGEISVEPEDVEL